MNTRPALLTDAAAIVEIWNAIIRDPHITFTTVLKTVDGIGAMIAERQAAGEAFYVGEADGAVVGFATYSAFRGGPGYARTKELSINLAPEARGHGLGRALMGALEAHGRAAGVHSLVAGVSGANADGIAFHKAVGFDVAGILPEAGWKYGVYLDLVLMQKRLLAAPS
ncbi:N-acetyltransferase family protein [Acuticoccus sp. M5D2P5]|uniref:GNAT family N-acetyltransferase n=1 Tax=Acuticoccus kalidii TaxID=2910977 RepID=UPI001F1A21C5|nr:GNAT family N-acetyltransferase [Acuticoccus kalidii]MCF3934252.1 N-acetyltransferase family protein [Acuticoccus kalidii]